MVIPRDRQGPQGAMNREIVVPEPYGPKVVKADKAISRVLLLEDDPTNRRLLTNFITKWGTRDASPEQAAKFKVVAVESGDEAIAELKKGNIDAVVSDLMVPGIQGEEVVGFARRQDPLMPILICSGKPRATVGNVGQDLFLQKGEFIASDLFNTLDTLDYQLRRVRDWEGVATRDVLVVEDYEPMARLIETLLKPFGLTKENITIVDNGEDAVTTFKDMRFDLVFADLGLPGRIQGEHFIPWARRMNPWTPIVVVTNKLREDVTELGQDEYMYKGGEMSPTNFRGMFTRLDDLLKHRTMWSDERKVWFLRERNRREGVVEKEISDVCGWSHERAQQYMQCFRDLGLDPMMARDIGGAIALIGRDRNVVVNMDQSKFKWEMLLGAGHATAAHEKTELLGKHGKVSPVVFDPKNIEMTSTKLVSIHSDLAEIAAMAYEVRSDSGVHLLMPDAINTGYAGFAEQDFANFRFDSQLEKSWTIASVAYRVVIYGQQANEAKDAPVRQRLAQVSRGFRERMDEVIGDDYIKANFHSVIAEYERGYHQTRVESTVI